MLSIKFNNTLILKGFILLNKLVEFSFLAIEKNVLKTFKITAIAKNTTSFFY